MVFPQSFLPVQYNTEQRNFSSCREGGREEKGRVLSKPCLLLDVVGGKISCMFLHSVWSTVHASFFKRFQKGKMHKNASPDQKKQWSEGLRQVLYYYRREGLFRNSNQDFGGKRREEDRTKKEEICWKFFSAAFSEGPSTPVGVRGILRGNLLYCTVSGRAAID